MLNGFDIKRHEAEERLFSQKVLDIPKTPVPIRFKGLEEYKKNYLYYAMTAAMEITQSGRLWSCWIGGEDGPEAFLVATYSDDKGETWQDIQFVIDPHSDELPFSMNTHVAGLWCDPKGRLWLFYQQSFGMWDGAGANFAMVCENPDEENPRWNEPYLVTPGASVKKPIVLSNGEWLMPVSIWERWHITPPLQDCHHEYDSIRGANVFVSCDEGKTWEYRGGVIFEDSSFNEHSLAELSNGDIMMISRCHSAIKKSYSRDGGRTWTPEEEYFKHVNSMASIRKLASGNLLLVKHGVSIDTVTETRTQLTAFISKDDGKTWLGGLLLDGRENVSYPSIAQGADGAIYVQYDYQRKPKAEILFAKFTEEDVLAGKLINASSKLQNIIKDINGINGVKNTVFDGFCVFDEGDGSKENPYVIANAAHYKYLSKCAYSGENFNGKYFIQKSDIDFDGENITPVYQFGGNYNGNNFYMKNFRIEAPYLSYRGLFCRVSGGCIKNIRVSEALIKGKTKIAAIAGSIDTANGKNTVIENCIIEETVQIIGYLKTAGIVGSAVGNVDVKNCANKASLLIPRTSSDIGKSSFVGGIAGFCDGNIQIENCQNHGKITVKNTVAARMGGIAAGEKLKLIKNCKNYGDIYLDTATEESFIGGICAKCEEAVEIIDCENTGAIKSGSPNRVWADNIINKTSEKND